MTVVTDTPETEIVTTRRVCCDGGEGPLGHPRIWLTIGESGEVVCPYCGKKYVLDPNCAAAH